MKPARLLIFSILIMVIAMGAVQAQRRWERLPPPRDPQFYVPRNRLEDIDGRMETLLIKGRHWVGTVRAQAVRRWGRDSVMLEMDVVDAEGTERMLVFGRLDLGDDPEDVAEAVCAARPATPPDR